MSREIPWSRRLGFRLGGLTLLVLLASLLLVAASFFILSALQADAASTELYSRGRFLCSQLRADTYKLAAASMDKERDAAQRELERTIKAMEDRYRILLNGDAALGVPAVSDASLLAGIHDRQHNWDTQLKPALERIAKGAARADAEKELPSVEKWTAEWNSSLEQGVGEFKALLRSRVQWFQGILLGFAVLVLVAAGVQFWLARGVALRTRRMAQTAERIAAGELELKAAVVGVDETAALGDAFDAMTVALRQSLEKEKDRRAHIEKLLSSIREATQQMTSTGAEILASTTQQASSAEEQAAAVAQTVSTVTEVSQTAEQAAQRARNVGDAVQKTRQIGEAGRKVVEDSIGALDVVQGQVESTAENILALAEQSQAIGDLIARVTDVAEQTNLLALNASIEAARAGEHGKGFAVVAGEVKELAGKSREATVQVRQILGEIQKATNAAVLSTEAVTKGVTAASKVAMQAGQTIRALTETLTETAQAAAQIVASAGQQAAGMGQVQQAMSNIEQAARQTLAAVRQAEQAAQDLNKLAVRLDSLIGRTK
jgi:methyl-accepting chemotaxis protein